MFAPNGSNYLNNLPTTTRLAPPANLGALGLNHRTTSLSDGAHRVATQKTHIHCQTDPCRCAHCLLLQATGLFRPRRLKASLGLPVAETGPSSSAPIQHTRPRKHGPHF